jgi:hypothetical protein
MLPFIALTVGVLSFIVVRAIVQNAGLSIVISWTAILVIAVGICVNFFWFHYVTIDSNEVRVVRCFGFLRRSIPTSKIESVGTRPQTSAYGLLRPTLAVRLNLQNGVLEFGQAYESGALRQALSLLVATGIPVDPRLLRKFRLGDDQKFEPRRPRASDQ